MLLKLGLDVLHRRIEEWTEEALVEDDAPNSHIEGFREYGSDLVAFLHDLVEQLELGQEELQLSGTNVTSYELCEEVVRVLVAVEQGEFGEQPLGVEVEEFKPVMEAVAEVLDGPLEDYDEELEEANDYLEEFMANVW